MNAPLIPQANPGAAFRSRRDALLKAAADVLDGGWDITYEESELTGLAGVVTTFRVEPGKVTLNREGALNSRMLFQEGVSHESLYQMEFGTLMITVKATNVFYDIVPDGGTIDLTYQIVIENTEAGMIDYHLDIRAK